MLCFGHTEHAIPSKFCSLLRFFSSCTASETRFQNAAMKILFDATRFDAATLPSFDSILMLPLVIYVTLAVP